jgi:hypothetical protein
MRMLDKYRIKKWQKKRRPILTPEVVTKRPEWTLTLMDWALEEWMKLIFSDECSVELSEEPAPRDRSS